MPLWFPLLWPEDIGGTKRVSAFRLHDEPGDSFNTRRFYLGCQLRLPDGSVTEVYSRTVEVQLPDTFLPANRIPRGLYDRLERELRDSVRQKYSAGVENPRKTA